MRFKVVDETKFSDKGLKDHYPKHTAKNWAEYFLHNDGEMLFPMTEKEYDEEADALSKRPVRTSDINSDDEVIGFRSNRNATIKYNKKDKEIVIYDASTPNAKTITYYQAANDRRYEKLKAQQYLREVEPEDDYYNV